MLKKVVFLFVCILFLNQFAFGQYFSDVYFPQKADVRAVAMGGCYTSTSIGIESLYGNPAGISLGDKACLTMSGKSYIYGLSQYEDDYYGDDSDYTGKYKFFPKLMNFGMMFPISLKNYKNPLSVGVAYKSIYDWKYKFNYENISDNEDIEFELDRKGIVNSLSFSLGTTFSEKYSVGVSLNFPVLNGCEVSYQYESDSEDLKEVVEWDVSSNTTFEIGIIAKLNEKLTLGLSHVSSNELEIDNGKYSYESENGDFSGDIEYEFDYDLPSFTSFGISYKYSSVLLLTADLQLKRWGDIELNGEDKDDFENSLSYRCGFEYGSNILFRGGVFIDKLDAITKDDEQALLKGISAGIGFNKKDINLNLGGQYSFSTFDTDVDETYEYRDRKLVLYANLNYYFDFVLGN